MRNYRTLDRMATSDSEECYEGGAAFLLFLEEPAREMAIVQVVGLQGVYEHPLSLDARSGE